MLWQSEVDKYCRKMWDDAYENERALEIKKIEMCWDFYKGNQIPYARRYRDETSEEWEEKEKIPWNYFKKIIDKYVYGVSGQKITITFEKDENYQDIWDKIVAPAIDDETHVNRQFMTIQRIAEISNTCVVMIRTHENEDTQEIIPYFEPVDGKYIDFIPDEDDHNKIAKVVICYDYEAVDSRTNSKCLKKFEMWDKDYQTIAIWDDQNKRYVEDPVQIDNLYGFIPMAIFQPQEDHESFWGISMADDLCQINRVYNDLWTYFNVLIEMQSFSTLMINVEGDEIDFKLGPKRVMKIAGLEGDDGNKNDAKFITPDADFEGVRKSIESFKAELTDVSSVPTSVVFSGSFNAPESGYALKIKQEPIQNLWDERKLSYGPSYNQLAQKSVRVYEIANGKNPQEVNKIKISSTVKFANPPIVVPAIEKMSQDEFDLRHDLITQIDMMMEKYPDLSREQAEQKLAENITTNNKIEMASFGQSDRDMKILELEEALDNAVDDEEIKRISAQLINLGRVQELQKDEIRMRKDR